MNHDESRGVEIAKGIRSCSTMVFVPVIALAVGIEVGRRTGWCLGILAFVGAFWLSSVGLRALINRNKTGLTIQDCLMPSLLSLICSIVFLPMKLLSANLFGPAECIISGIVLSVCLLGYRAGRIKNPYWLTLPFLTFIYELLPINLPSDLDDILALTANTFVPFIAWTKKEDCVPAVCNDEHRIEQLENNDAIAVECESIAQPPTSDNVVSRACGQVNSVVAGVNEVLDEIDEVKGCVGRIKNSL